MKTIILGKAAYSSNRKTNLVELRIELKNNGHETNYETLVDLKDVPVFSMSGGIWNSSHSDYVSCGQNIDEIKELFPENKQVQRLAEIWELYHLNNFNAGTKKQCDAVDLWRKENNIKGWDYDKACEYLKSIDLYEDRGIKYGSTWLYKPIPENILSEIKEIIKD